MYFSLQDEEQNISTLPSKGVNQTKAKNTGFPHFLQHIMSSSIINKPPKEYINNINKL